MVIDHCGIIVPFEASGKVKMQDRKLRKGSGSLDMIINVPFITVDDEFMHEIAGAKPEQVAGKLTVDKQRPPEDVFLKRLLMEKESVSR